MNPRRAHLLAALAAIGTCVSARAQTTTLSGGFTGTTLDSGWTVGGSGYTPTLTANGGGDASGSGWLELTSSAGNESTYALDTTSFASAHATITATFNYAAFNGSGADGITFFLADASVPFSVGAFGGSLGYAQKTLAGGGGANINGMAGGYLGIGVDEYGNYSNPTEGRIGGIGATSNAIAVRGPGSGLTGYNYLGGTGSLATPLSYPSQTTRPSGSESETIQMILTATNQLTVSIEFGNSGVFVQEFTADLSGYARPNNLVMGFTGSTGGSTDIHEVQDVALTSVVANLWTNTAGTNAWGAQGTTTNAANWANTPAANPGVGGDILLDNTYVSTAQNIAVTGNQVIRNLQIDAPFSYTLSGGSLEFNGSSAIGPSGIIVTQVNGTANQTVGSNITADNAIQIQNNSNSTLALTGSTMAIGANAVTFNGSGTTTVSNAISGTGGSIVQSGAGDTVLSGSNTYTGGTTISAGTLTVNNNSGLGTGSVTLSGGALASTAGSSISNSIALTGSAGLTGITTSGALTETGGSYTLNMENATQSGSVALSNTSTARTLTVETDAGTSTISGVISNGGGSTGDGLTKTGVGTLILSGTNTYTGATTLSAGTLQLGANNTINSSSNVTIAGGTLALNGFSDKVGNLTITGNSTLDFGAGSSTNAFVFGSLTDASNSVLTVANFGSSDALATTTASLATTLLNDIYFAGSGSGTVEAGSATTNDGVSSYRITANTAFTTWNGSGTNNNWTTGADWVGGTAPASANTTKVDFTGSTRLTPTLTANTTVNAMRFDTAASSFNITEAGKTLTLSGTVPSIIQQSSAAQTISGGTVALGANAIVDVTGTGALNISSVISGTGFSIDKLDAGTLDLSGANTYTGGTIVGGGIVGVSGSNSALGTGAVSVANGATLQVNGNNSLTLANALTINGNGAANGAIDSNPGAAYTTTLTGGITLGSNSTISSDAGTLAITTGAITGSGNNLTLAGAGNMTISSAITTGTGSLTLGGTGTITLSGSNTYTGTTTVNSGTLNLSSAANPIVNGDLTINAGTVNETTSNEIGSSSTVTLNAGTLALGTGVSQTLIALGTAAGSNISLNGTSSLTLNNSGTADVFGTISGTGSLATENTGTTVLSGANSYSGGTTTSSIINATNSSAFGTGAVTVNSGGNVQIQNNVTIGNAFTINSTGTAFAGAFENVSGNNTLSGPIAVSGSSRIQSDSGSLAVSGAVGLSGNSLDVGGNSTTTIGGAITGTSTSNLTKDGSGTLTLSGSNSAFLGSVTMNGGTLVGASAGAFGGSSATHNAIAVNSGTLQTNANGALTSFNSLTVASGAALNTNGFNETVGAFADNGALNLGTGSTLTLTGASSLNGSLSGSGTIVLNAGSTLILGANFNDSNLNIDLNGGTLYLNGTNDTFGALTVTGNSTLDFGAGTGSTINFSSTTMSGSSILTVANWTNLQDYFYTQAFTGATPNARGGTPEDQIVFNGYSASSTAWQGGFGTQITPVPEPGTYGAIFAALSAAAIVVSRSRRLRKA